MRAKFLHRALLAIGLAVVMCGFSMQASATTFNFSQSSGFSVAYGTLESDQTASPYNDIKWYESASGVAPPSGYFDTIAWGRSNNAAGLMGSDPFGAYGNTGNTNTAYSGLRVLGQAGSVSTGASVGDLGSWVTISTVYHQNNEISSTWATLAAALIYSELLIDSNGAPGSVVPITFEETLNSGDPVASRDLFTFPNVTFAFEPFSYGGYQYEAVFQLANFVNSSSNFPDCPGGICTVWTNEGVTSHMDVQMAIRELPVPEPATLTLLGLGLLGLGLGYARRRRKNG